MTRSVPPDLAGERTDKVVAVLWELSRAAARNLVETGAAVVNGVVVRPGTRLEAGARLAVDLPAAPAGLAAEPVPFAVRYEDPDLLVVDKPAGIVVHPGAGTSRGTLAAGLLHRYPDLGGLAGEHRWGIVHRLDRETSGLLVVARTPEAHRTLQRSLQRRRVEREYLAMVYGTLAVATGTVDAPIGRDPRHPTRMAVRLDGRPARTHYRRLAQWARAAVLEVRLETGRTHQIRVHLASVGHPLVGDPTYGRRPPLPAGADPGRVWLHALRLAFPHPRSGVVVETIAPLPDDLAASIAALGEPETGDVAAIGIEAD